MKKGIHPHLKYTRSSAQHEVYLFHVFMQIYPTLYIAQRYDTLYYYFIEFVK